MTSGCVGFSRCRVQFIRNGEQRAERDYSDRSVVELRQYDFANYSIRALDIENNREEIFAVPLKNENQYKRGKSSTVPDEIQGAAGTYCLWLNADSRTPFHNSLNLAIEEIKLMSGGSSETSESPFTAARTGSQYNNQDSSQSQDQMNRHSSNYTGGDDRDSSKSIYQHDRDRYETTGRRDQDSSRAKDQYDRDRYDTASRHDHGSSRPKDQYGQDRYDDGSSRTSSRDTGGTSLRTDRDRYETTSRSDHGSSSSGSRDLQGGSHRTERDRYETTGRSGHHGSSSSGSQDRYETTGRRDQDSSRPKDQYGQDRYETTGRRDQDSSRPKDQHDRDRYETTGRLEQDSSRAKDQHDRDRYDTTSRREQDSSRAKDQHDRDRYDTTSRHDHGSSRSGSRDPGGASLRTDRDSRRSNQQDDRNDDDKHTTVGSSSRNKQTASKSKEQSNQKDILVDVYRLGQLITDGKTNEAVDIARKLAQERVQLEANLTDRILKEKSISIKIKIDSDSSKISNKYDEQVMNVYPSTTIAQLRAAFAHTQNLPSENQCVFVNGHLAHEKSTMKDLDVRDDTLFVLFVIA